jgi:guanidinoacetate N-methyltransferase
LSKNANVKPDQSPTVSARELIGFPANPAEWKNSPAIYDSNGDSLTILGHPVMESWEAPYMKALAEVATIKGGRILELGFGLGMSAGYIQEHPITEHVIIEANVDVCQKARAFAASAKYPTTIIEGLWQEVIPKLEGESFSGILFDTYPLNLHEVHRQHFWFFPEAFRLLSPQGVFTYYSDEVSDFSGEHLKALKDAGFMDIAGKICHVTPPENCLYWKAETFLVPKITK